MKMRNGKYVARDGAVLFTKQACLDHEDLEKRRDVIRAQVDRYLRMTAKTDEDKAIAREYIMEWLEYDLRQRPERYGVPVPPPQPTEQEGPHETIT